MPIKNLGDSGSIMCKPARDNRALSVGRLHRRTIASENGKCCLGCHCKLPAMSSLPTMAVRSLERTTPVSTTLPLACMGYFVNIPRLWLSADYRCPPRIPGLTNELPEQKRIRDPQRYSSFRRTKRRRQQWHLRCHTLVFRKIYRGWQLHP